MRINRKAFDVVAYSSETSWMGESTFTKIVEDTMERRFWSAASKSENN